ncbi:MAG: hypothetical protein FJ267_14265 [Planctomycetes bacterium]|nr:hypothetical protein [Planctomycetota bacterium]
MKDTIIFDGVKYNSVGYKVLSYAKFRSRIEDGTFTVENYLKFRFKQVKPSDVKRAIDALVRNGHLQKLDNDRYRFTESGVLFKLNSTHKAHMYERQQNKKNQVPDDDDEDLF